MKVLQKSFVHRKPSPHCVHSSHYFLQIFMVCFSQFRKPRGPVFQDPGRCPGSVFLFFLHFTEVLLYTGTYYFQFKDLLKMKVRLRAFYRRKQDTEIGLEIQSYNLKYLIRASSSKVKKEMSKIEYPPTKKINMGAFI